jgi:hypothetical protein
MNSHNRLKNQQNNQGNNTKREQKWVTFTYTGNYKHIITKLFTDTNLKVAFKTTTTVGKLSGDTWTTNTYEQSSIYKMTCQSCHKVYTGQMGRNLKTRYKEHVRNIRFNKDESAFPQHILGKGHQHGPMEQIMEIIECARKGNIMNTKENYYIYQFKQLNELREQKTIKKTITRTVC